MFTVTLPTEPGPERDEALLTLSWMLRGFVSAVALSYTAGAPRRVESVAKCHTLLAQVRPFVDDNEWERLNYGIPNAGV